MQSTKACSRKHFVHCRFFLPLFDPKEVVEQQGRGATCTFTSEFQHFLSTHNAAGARHKRVSMLMIADFRQKHTRTVVSCGEGQCSDKPMSLNIFNRVFNPLIVSVSAHRVGLGFKSLRRFMIFLGGVLDSQEEDVQVLQSTVQSIWYIPSTCVFPDG